MENGAPAKKPIASHLDISFLIRLCFILTIAASLVIYFKKIIQAPGTNFDDAYIFIRYVNNFRAGLGHAWNPDGVQVYGNTSLLHFFVILILKSIRPYADWFILKVASATPAALAALFLAVTCALVTRSKYLRKNFLLWGAVLLPLLLSNELYIYHSLTGMDTMLSVLTNSILVFCTLLLVARERVGLAALVALSSYLSYLARPDNAIYAVLFPVFTIVFLASSGNRTKLLAAFLGILCVVGIADVAAKLVIFGDPVPLAFYAKRTGYYVGYVGGFQWNPVEFILVQLQSVLPFVILGVLFVKRKHLPLLAAFLLPVFFTYAYYFSIVQIMGHYSRFYYPSLPFIVMASVMVVDSSLLTPADSLIMNKKNLVSRLAVVMLVWAVLPSAINALPRYYQRYFIVEAPVANEEDFYETTAKTPLPYIGWWKSMVAVRDICTGVPDGLVVSMSEYGLIGASAPDITIIDPVGLNDRQFAHQGFSAEALIARGPDLIWFPHYHYTRIRFEILTCDAFWNHYDYYPKAFDYGLAIRRDSKHFEQLSDVLSRSWVKFYETFALGDYLADRKEDGAQKIGPSS